MQERDNKWLRERLKYLWQRYFSDVPIANTIIIKFGQSAKTRLGSIKPGRIYKKEHSIITLNGHFRDVNIPDFVVDGVIAHEFMHYAHGFASPHEQAFRHPHKGGVVNEDMKERGLGEILKLEKKWLKENWRDYLLANHKFTVRKRALKFKLFGF